MQDLQHKILDVKSQNVSPEKLRLTGWRTKRGALYQTQYLFSYGGGVLFLMYRSVFVESVFPNRTTTWWLLTFVVLFSQSLGRKHKEWASTYLHRWSMSTCGPGLECMSCRIYFSNRWLLLSFSHLWGWHCFSENFQYNAISGGIISFILANFVHAYTLTKLALRGLTCCYLYREICLEHVIKRKANYKCGSIIVKNLIHRNRNSLMKKACDHSPMITGKNHITDNGIGCLFGGQWFFCPVAT